MFGPNYSLSMIKQAEVQPASLELLHGSALHLPYRDHGFDLVYYVDAIHHFGDHTQFIAEAFGVLKHNGALAVIGHDPHQSTTNWYIYEYFNQVRDTDLDRYSSGKSITKSREMEGYKNISVQTVEYMHNVHVGDTVLRDLVLKKSASSQLALLSDDEYMDDMQGIGHSINGAAARGEEIVFSSDIHVQIFLGYKR